MEYQEGSDTKQSELYAHKNCNPYYSYFINQTICLHLLYNGFSNVILRIIHFLLSKRKTKQCNVSQQMIVFFAQLHAITREKVGQHSAESWSTFFARYTTTAESLLYKRTKVNCIDFRSERRGKRA